MRAGLAVIAVLAVAAGCSMLQEPAIVVDDVAAGLVAAPAGDDTAVGVIAAPIDEVSLINIKNIDESLSTALNVYDAWTLRLQAVGPWIAVVAMAAVAILLPLFSYVLPKIAYRWVEDRRNKRRCG